LLYIYIVAEVFKGIPKIGIPKIGIPYEKDIPFKKKEGRERRNSLQITP